MRGKCHMRAGSKDVRQRWCSVSHTLNMIHAIPRHKGTNKLVDGCYSFWQGGVFPLLNTVMDGSPDLRRHLYDRCMSYMCVCTRLRSTLFADAIATARTETAALQHFILLCSQNEHHPATASTTGGGFSDRPENSVDLYHTCYCLSGLSSAQHDVRISPTPPFFAEVVDGGDEDGATRASSIIVGRRDNAVGATHPMFNVRVDQANAALARFYDRIEEVA